ncbi:MAG: efflux RND transporter periplasmic adaptor subunit [Candidatus Contendobacter sp.]|nr:efflux RND transporter periplasmic adaptor subunit [Candidatus Contendobacter sp.]
MPCQANLENQGDMLMHRLQKPRLAVAVALAGLLAGWSPVTVSQGKILYYRNPMGLADISPTPKQDSMGMDYIPVYEGEDAGGDQISISPQKVQKLGVRTEPAQRRILSRPVRAVGLIGPDERRLFIVAPRFEGWIERLLVNSTGQTVKRGETLMAVYSPALITAQREYLMAGEGLRTVDPIPAPPLSPGQIPPAPLLPQGAKGRERMSQLTETALQRLRNWEISDDQIERLRREGKPQQNLLLKSPVDGVVLEKTAIQGMRFMPGEALYRIADLSMLWLIVEVFEQDLSLVRPGQDAQITVNAFPGEEFHGKVAFIYPTLNAQTRTAQVRIELPNPQGRLRPAMYASVLLAAGSGRAPVLTVPASAVLQSGVRQVVLVELGEGRYQPREVRIGRRGDEQVQVLEGLSDGERVVTSANFLIDAESNLKAALSSFGDTSFPTPALPREGGGSAAAPAHVHEGH